MVAAVVVVVVVVLTTGYSLERHTFLKETLPPVRLLLLVVVNRMVLLVVVMVQVENGWKYIRYVHRKSKSLVVSDTLLTLVLLDHPATLPTLLARVPMVVVAKVPKIAREEIGSW